MRWQELVNGELLLRAERDFDAIVTTDKRLRYQQSLAGRRLAIIVLPTTSWPILRMHTARIAAAVDSIHPGAYLELQLPE